MGAQDPADDVRRVCAIAEIAVIRVDLNARGDRLTALAHLPKPVDAGAELVEQPVPGAGVEWLAEINRALPIPVIADESPRTPSDVFSVKTTKSGGLRATAAIASIAVVAGIPCHGGTSIESTWGSELFGPLLVREELPATPLRCAGGNLHLPDGPGLGIELDPAAVAAFTRR
ncbi:enolase C-terminal domain-like protein [Lentzea flava]|uniref:Enolase C-terminal domain-containing protein n=1 Tax=Lentzea flava TaxID=103732 RepID=A0ABQ2UF86_9PSEU|nr:enolase C-terminal domain-like protein [Lentzea flava]MCP2197991.1 Enolase C-terminal domain-like [Lentzea flava]GGU23902.1 hypothetical protein GCM10010178_15110 [Lentzea flava]